eukprot:332892_1
MREFYHWRNVLQETFERFSTSGIKSVTKQSDTIYHGLTSVMCIDKYQGTYYGPCLTTTDLHQARLCAGKNGMILVMKLKSGNKGLDISWISDVTDFENGREFLLFNQQIDIERWFSASDYNQHYKIYNNLFKINNSLNKSYIKQQRHKPQIQISNQNFRDD